MPYQIDRFDGTVLVNLADGVVDTTTDLRLVGRNVAGYGEVQNENFVKLLENFARADTPPPKALVGQLWFDKNADKLRPSVFDGSQWRNLAITQVQATEPSNAKEGDLWWDTVNNKFDVGTDHPVSVGYIDDEPYMVMANASFTIDQTETPLTGFTVIRPGITAKTTNANGITSGVTRFFGTAGDADRLGGRLADTWANREEDEIITGNFKFQNADGYSVGPNNELKINVDTGNQNARIVNEIDDVLIFGVNYSGSTTDKTVFAISDKNILPFGDNEVNLGSLSLKFRNIYADAIFANVIGDIVGQTQGTHTGDTIGNHIGDMTGDSIGIHTGSVKNNVDGNVLVDADNLRFEGTSALVDDGVYASTIQTISGNKTFTGTNIFTGFNNFNGTLQSTNHNMAQGTIGKGAVSALDTGKDRATFLDSVTIDTVRIADSEILNVDLKGGRISSGTVVDGADIGQNSPAIQVKAQKFVDAVGTEVTRFSTDGDFLANSDTNIPTEKAIKTYVDTKFGQVGQDIQFYLDTKDMSTDDVKTQLTRLAPPDNFPEGTIARILGSYYFANYSTNTFFQRKKTTVVPPGIGRIGGYTRVDVVQNQNDLINAKSSFTGYEFKLSATGAIVEDSQNFSPNADLATFATKLSNGTITAWIEFASEVNSDVADEFSTDAVEGARIVVVRNGLVETYSSNVSLTQLVVGNTTYERSGGIVVTGAVNIAGFAVSVNIYAFDRIARTSQADWVYVGNI